MNRYAVAPFSSDFGYVEARYFPYTSKKAAFKAAKSEGSDAIWRESDGNLLRK